MRFLETIESIELVDIGTLQPVTQQGKEVDKEETLLETKTKTNLMMMILLQTILTNLLKLMLDTLVFFSSPFLATCLAPYANKDKARKVP